jgi:hypothetical protein
MIPMACPACGRKGTIPPDKLNARMHCKKCDAVFHMNSNGRVILGEPPHAGDKSDRKAGRARQTSGNVDLSLAGTLKAIPTPVKVGAVVVAVAALIFFTVDFSGDNSPKPVATNVAQGIVNGDKSRVTSLAMDKTEGSAGEWFEKVRSSSPSLTAGLSSIDIKVELVNQNGPGGTQHWMATINGLKSGTGELAEPAFVNIYIRRYRKKWCMDGNLALQELAKGQGTAKK